MLQQDSYRTRSSTADAADGALLWQCCQKRQQAKQAEKNQENHLWLRLLSVMLPEFDSARSLCLLVSLRVEASRKAGCRQTLPLVLDLFQGVMPAW